MLLVWSLQIMRVYDLASVGFPCACSLLCALLQVVEPGDKVLVGVNGIWGERMTVLTARYGADVVRMDTPAGTVFSVADVAAALRANPGVKVVFLVHGESSTGTLQPLEGLGDLCHSHGEYLLLQQSSLLGREIFFQ